MLNEHEQNFTLGQALRLKLVLLSHGTEGATWKTVPDLLASLAQMERWILLGELPRKEASDGRG